MGVFWGRIPKELRRNGATAYYGQQQSAAAVEDSGKELAERIRQIVETTGCEKVNIIAHSKGGLDSRAAIAHAGCAPYVATLTTINTPPPGLHLCRVPAGQGLPGRPAENRGGLQCRDEAGGRPQPGLPGGGLEAPGVLSEK